MTTTTNPLNSTPSTGITQAAANDIDPSVVNPAMQSMDPGLTTLSAEGLLMYCESQLNDLDGQVNDQIKQQRVALAERQAIQTAQGVFTSFGTAGPQDPTSMQNCVDALNQAIAQCPTGDPVAGQLAAFRDKMVSQYSFVAPRQLSAEEQEVLGQAKIDQTAGRATLSTPFPVGFPPDEAAAFKNMSPKDVISKLNAVAAGSLQQPNKDNNEWQGTVQSLENIGDDVKSSADIQLLKLQDLVSQRQQAVQLCSGMMSKTDQTLEDQAKAVGH